MNIKIGPVTYELLPMGDSSKGDYFGLVDHAKGKIYIDSDCRQDRRGLTLLHELTHAVLHLGGYSEESENEKLVRHISSLFYQILNDNPGLFPDPSAKLAEPKCPTE